MAFAALQFLLQIQINPTCLKIQEQESLLSQLLFLY